MNIQTQDGRRDYKMKKIVSFFTVLLLTVCIASCGGMVTQLKMQEPEAGKSIVIGAVLVENNGIDDMYEAQKANIVVVLIGKHIINGEEFIQGYRLKTDANGYFYLPNVPQGAYVLKGIEVDIGFSGRVLISSRWDGSNQIFIPAGKMIDHVVRSWPEEIHENVIDLRINYFMFDPSRRIYADQFMSLKENTLAIEGRSQTMPNPKVYYRDKYPQIKSFKKQ